MLVEDPDEELEAALKLPDELTSDSALYDLKSLIAADEKPPSDSKIG